ncbi:hypothetical protein APASM_1660 [Actinosynnema pretiosum subsp. pretiosum]|nr:hypothetical protein APASM_1660 [Actinosynnema pretiosum subsp. pretiosum]
MPITFDTTGLEQRDTSVWVNPATGGVVTLDYFDLAPDLPAALEDVDLLRHRLAGFTAKAGCLIEADVVQLDGVPALYQLLKVPFPNRPAGQVFLASCTVPRAGCSAVLKLQSPELGMTGMREALLMARLGHENWVVPHPYAPELRGVLPYHLGDAAEHDPQFPDHPLTRARAWARHVALTGRVDPRFAALPPFRPQG